MTTEGAVVFRVLARTVLVLSAAVLTACNTVTTVVKERLSSEGPASPIGRAIAGLGDLPFASAYVRVGDRFETLVVLGSIDASGVQTWYGRQGVELQLQGDRVIYSRGLPVDVLETYPASPAFAQIDYDCVGGPPYAAAEAALYYTRIAGSVEFTAEVRRALACRFESIVTPGYSGEALRVDEVYELPPHPRPQRRTKWLHPQTRQLLRLEYAEHPVAPQFTIAWLKPAAVR